MELGSLYDVLHNASIVLESDIVFPIIQDIASGLRFLHGADPPVIHGDLKSKNVLIDANFRAKVADFGLSRDLFSRDYYRDSPGKNPLPVRWMAPECHQQNVFTTNSDVVRTSSSNHP